MFRPVNRRIWARCGRHESLLSGNSAYDSEADWIDYRAAGIERPEDIVPAEVRALEMVPTVRPDVVISTGAAPGYFALRLGKMLRAQTIWLDSLANVETLSQAGEMAGPYADLWLTQWPELAGDAGPSYDGKVI